MTAPVVSCANAAIGHWDPIAAAERALRSRKDITAMTTRWRAVSSGDPAGATIVGPRDYEEMPVEDKRQ